MEAEIPPESAGGEASNQPALSSGKSRRAAPARLARYYLNGQAGGDVGRQAVVQEGAPEAALLGACREHLDLLVQVLHAGAASEASLGASGAAGEALARGSAELAQALRGSSPLAGPSRQLQRRGSPSPSARPNVRFHLARDIFGEPGGDAATSSVARDSALGAQGDPAAQAGAGTLEMSREGALSSGDKPGDGVIDSREASSESGKNATIANVTRTLSQLVHREPNRLERLTGGSVGGESSVDISLTKFERACTATLADIAPTRDPHLSWTLGGTTTPRQFCQRVVVSSHFEWLVAAVILANSVLIGMQADWGVHNPGEELPLMYRALDNSLVAFFTLELILRIVAEGRSFVSRKNAQFGWNIFDSALVVFSYLELLTSFLGVSFIKTNVTRLLRLSRLVRAMRLIRIIRFFSELRVMVLAIGSSLRLLLWASCLLMMLMYLFAVMFVQIVENELASAGDPVHNEDELRAHWGSLSRALYTLYMSITNGMSWDAAAEPLLMISPALALAFCAYIAIALFGVLNTITGIFCEKAMQIASADEDCMMWNELDRRKRWVRDVRRLFRSAEGGHTGRLDWDSFCNLLGDLQMQNVLKSLGVDVTAIEPRMLFDLFDTDGGGTVEINEFASGLMKLHGSAKAVDLARIKYKMVGMNTRIKEIKQMLESQGFAASSPTQ